MNSARGIRYVQYLIGHIGHPMIEHPDPPDARDVSA